MSQRTLLLTALTLFCVSLFAQGYSRYSLVGSAPYLHLAVLCCMYRTTTLDYSNYSLEYTLLYSTAAASLHVLHCTLHRPSTWMSRKVLVCLSVPPDTKLTTTNVGRCVILFDWQHQRCPFLSLLHHAQCNFARLRAERFQGGPSQRHSLN